MRAEVVLCELFVALLGAGLSDLAKQNAGVAQLAAQLPCKQTVAGSIPAVGTWAVGRFPVCSTVQ